MNVMDKLSLVIDTILFIIIIIIIISSSISSSSIIMIIIIITVIIIINCDNRRIETHQLLITSLHPDDQTQPTFEMTPGFKLFTVVCMYLVKSN